MKFLHVLPASFTCILIATTASAQITVTGQWDFKQGDLRATIGADLQYLNNTASITSFPTLAISEQSITVMAFGSNTASQGFYMRHGASPNGGGQFVNQYTLVMDVMFSPPSSGQLRALFQTDPFNDPGDDAEFYIGSSTSTPDANGLGAYGQFHGLLLRNTWYRIAFAVDLTATNTQLAKYINGVEVGAQSLPGGIDGPCALGPTALLFTTGLTNGGYTQPGYVSSIQFLNGCLSSNAIAALGGPTATGIPPGAHLNIRNGSLPSSVELSWNGRQGPYAIQMSPNFSSTNWQYIGNLDSLGNFLFQTTAPSSAFRVNLASIPAAQIDPGTPAELSIPVGTVGSNSFSVPTKQILQPAGQTIGFRDRCLDITLSPDGTTVYIKNLTSLISVDVASWTVLQNIPYTGSYASMHGICVSPSGSNVYVTGSGGDFYNWAVGTNRTLTYLGELPIPTNTDPCGIAITPDGSAIYVCLGMNNTLRRTPLTTNARGEQFITSVAPYDVAVSSDGTIAYVSNWGGRIPTTNDLISYSAGVPVVVDSRGIAASGTVSVFDVSNDVEIAEIPTGLHPSSIRLSQDDSTLYVANANSDTVSVIDTESLTVVETIVVHPATNLPSGSGVNALALSPDGTRLYVACGGNNGIAVVELPNTQHTNSLVLGFLPTDWYPAGIAVDATNIYVVNASGRGCTNEDVYNFFGTANKIPIPSALALNKYTARVQENGRIPQVLQTALPAQPGQAPVPVPRHVGEPSLFQHVLYVVKENKTYDEVFGDMPQGNGDSYLCVFPQNTTPNHHALASQFVLLDNYYCNGVYSTDGHAWATEGNATDYWEKTLGGLARSSNLGTDPLMYSSSGFIWDNVLGHGLTFHNFGLMAYSFPQPSGTTWQQVYAQYLNNTGTITFNNYNGNPPPLNTNSSTNVSGFNFSIPDQVRITGFLSEFSAAESKGFWPEFNILYLPSDHTAGGAPNFPTPSAMVADNDLALGRAIDAVTHSQFWSNTVIFVIEDDPQGGWDHVDGHRSICMVISPYTYRGKTVSTFYNQTGLLHTMEQIMGIPPMNQLDAMGPLMFDCFTTNANYTPYTCLTNNVPLNQMNPGTTAALSRKDRYWAKLSLKQDFSKPDAANDDALNRIIWHSVRGDARYPAEWAGPHGKGLKKLGLALSKITKGRDDDD